MTIHHEQDDFNVEQEGLPAGFLFAIVTGIVITVAAVMLMAINVSMLKFEEARVESTEHSGYPLLRQTNAESQAKIGHYEAVDANAGTWRIPIDRAMELVVAEANAGGPVSAEMPTGR